MAAIPVSVTVRIPLTMPHKIMRGAIRAGMPSQSVRASSRLVGSGMVGQAYRPDRARMYTKTIRTAARRRPGTRPASNIFPHRYLGDNRVNDRRHRGRDQRPHDAGGESHGAREAGVVAGVAHGLDLHSAQAGGIGHGSPGNACEDHRPDDVDLGKPALHPPDAGEGEAKDAVGQPSRIHDLGCENEHRHRQDHELAHPVDDELRDDHQRHIDEGGDGDQRRH